jgi:hypothetical protein
MKHRYWSHFGLRPIFQGRNAALSIEPVLSFETIVDEYHRVADCTYELKMSRLELKVGSIDAEISAAQTFATRRATQLKTAEDQTAATKERLLRSFPEYDTRPLSARGVPIAAQLPNSENAKVVSASTNVEAVTQ